MKNPTETNPANEQHRPLAILVFILASLTAFAPLSIDMYPPSFTQIAGDFSVPVSSVELSLTIFFTGLAFGRMLYGTVTGRFGRKKPLYVGLVSTAFLRYLAPSRRISKP